MKIKLIRINKVKSTNDEALKLIKKNKIYPTIVFSDKQTKGRGTAGKKWVSLKGNMFLSILFQFNPKKINFRQYAILNAYLIRQILNKYITKRVRIKWPNDLVIEKKKICGILQEVINYKENFFLIVGIGINTHFSPSILNLKACSLANFSQKKVDNNRILKDIIKSYEKFISDCKKYNFEFLKKRLK